MKMLTIDYLLDQFEKNASFKDVISESLFRHGFARNTLTYKRLKQGEIGKIKVRKKDALAFVSTSSGAAEGVEVRDSYVYPSDVIIVGSAKVDDMEAAQSPEVLVDAALQLLEATMVKEDKLWKKLADASSIKITARCSDGRLNIDALLPTMASSFKSKVPLGTWIFGSQAWAKFIGPENKLLTPAMKNSLVNGGTIEKFLGAKIYTDFYRDPTLQVLDPKDVYLVAEPQFVGTVLERKVDYQEASGAALGKPETVITVELIESMAIIGNIIKGSI